MRPKLLEIEGLQSFRNLQRINFDELGETGLFGIFGPTGSGKSTVLDAITFALYGKVKRAERGTQGIINTNHQTARVSFTFELLKDGSIKTYRVERTYQRKKGSDNSCEPKVVRLIAVTEVGDIPVSDKTSEVSSRIEELLGLSHDDFTRAVVLPQNSFQEFLLLDNAKKREMLERIFYLEQYGKQLWEKLNRKMSSLNSRVDRLTGELSAYTDASDEALEQARQSMEAAALERTRAEQELKLLEAQNIEAREVWQLVQELAQVSQEEQQHQVAKEAVNKQRFQLERAVKADGLLDMLQKTQALASKLHGTEQELQLVKDCLPGVIAILNETKYEYDVIKNEAVTEQPRLVILKTRLIDALGIKASISAVRERINKLQAAAARWHDQITDKSESIRKATEELRSLEQGLNQLRWEMASMQTDPDYRLQMQAGARLENEVETLSGNAKQLDSQVETLNSVVTGLEQRLEQIKAAMELSQQARDAIYAIQQQHEGLKPEDRNSIMQSREELQALQMVYDILTLKKNELDQMNSKLAMQQSILRDFSVKIVILADGQAKAETVYEQSRLELEQAVEAMNRNTAFLLSKDLKEGEACPVCGSEHHPYPAAQAEGTELAVLEKQVETAGKRVADAARTLKEAENKCLIAGEQMIAIKQQIDQASQELELKIREYSKAQLRLPAELRGLALDQLRLELDLMNGLSAAKLEAYATWEQQEEEYHIEIQRINENLSQSRLLENGIAAELKVNQANKDQLEQTRRNANGIYNEKRQKHLGFLQHYHIENVTAELGRIAANDRKMTLLQQQIEQSQGLLVKKTALLDQLKQELAVLHGENMQVISDINNLNKQIIASELQIQELAGDADIDDEIKRINAKLEEYNKLDKQYQESIRILEIQHHELTTQQATLENQRKIHKESLESEEERTNKALREHGFIDRCEVEISLIPREQQTAMNEAIREYEQAEWNIQAHKDMVLKRLDSRSTTEEEWDQVSNAYQQMAICKEECVSRSEVARNNYMLLKDKHDKWVALHQSHRQLTHKYSLYEQIQKLLKAEKGKDNSFIDFIAEERLRYVAAKASETLGLMTKYKYALELDTDAGFIIRDNANGGVHRMVTSLSGGETFLTSLALALALSEQIQLKGQSPLEFFFLDEGFGTLDNDLLDSVIDSLERLSRKERVIGLISHVPELRNRIARRLIVDPPSPQGDGSRVRIEKA